MPLPILALTPFLAANGARIAIYAAVISSVIGVVWMHGFFKGREQLFEERAELATKKVELIVRQGAVTEKIITKYTHTTQTTTSVTEAIKHEVLHAAQTSVAAGSCTCHLDNQWLRLHNAAADNRIPEPAASVDGEGRTATAVEALRTVTENYAACHRTADKLDALQDWVREQLRISEATSEGER